MAKFDKSRDYGEIFGDSSGARFIQDGAYFDALGNEIAGQQDAEEKPARAKRAKKTEEPEVTSSEDQIAAILGESSGLETE